MNHWTYILLLKFINQFLINNCLSVCYGLWGPIIFNLNKGQALMAAEALMDTQSTYPVVGCVTLGAVFIDQAELIGLWVQGVQKGV